MPEPYLRRLIAIRRMLNSPLANVWHRAYDLLIPLWQEYQDNPSFRQNLMEIALENPSWISGFLSHVRDLSQANLLDDAFFELIEKSLSPQENGVNGRSVRGENKNSIIQAIKNFLKPRLQFLIKTIGMVVIVILMVMGLIYAFQYSGSTEWDVLQSEIEVNYTFPKYLVSGDQNVIDVAVTNLTENDFAGKMTLVFDKQLGSIMPAADQGLSWDFKVSPSGREAKQFRFLLIKRPKTGTVKFHFLISLDDGNKYKSINENFLVAPVPYIRSIWAWVLGGTGLVVGFLWEQLINKAKYLWGLIQKNVIAQP